MDDTGDRPGVDETTAEEALPLLSRQVPAIRTEWLFGDKAGGTVPIVIPGDARREMIGVYLTVGTSLVTLVPTGGVPSAEIDVIASQSYFEMRLASHGPMVQDIWTIDCPGGGSVTILLLTKEG